MPLFIATGLLAVQLAAAAASAAASVPPPAKIAEDWAAAPPPHRKAIAKAVRAIVAEENARQAEVPRRHELDSLHGGRYETFAQRFDDAVVPGCLRPDGLKRQPTSIGPFCVSGLLALPLVLVAKLRGKCG